MKEKISLRVKIRREWKNLKREARIMGWFRTLATTFCPFIYYRVSGLYWKILHRTTHVYHKVNTGLRPGWYDLDVRMLHCSFELLRVWVEEEHEGIEDINKKIEDSYSSWEEDKKTGWEERVLENRYNYQEQIDAYKEALRLYQWWKEVYPKHEDENPYMKAFDELHPDKENLWGRSEVASIDKDGDPTSYRCREQGTPEMIEKRRKVVIESMQYELDCMKDTTDNLISLAKIRHFLY